jgi:hypothetical protein
VLKASEHFQRDGHPIHSDISTVALDGASPIERDEGPRPPTPRPPSGRTKSGRQQSKQVQGGRDVTGDGGGPVGHRARDGNAGEVSTPLENLKLLSRPRPKGKRLSRADTPRDASVNRRAIATRKGQFLGGGALSPQLPERSWERRDRLHRVDSFPRSQAKLPPEQRDQDQAVAVSEHLEGTGDEKRVRLDDRRIFVGSESQA